MTIFQAPERSIKLYHCKFLRVEDTFYVTEPRDTFTAHEVLAKIHGIDDLLEKMKREASGKVDAGLMVIENASRGGVIFLAGFSGYYELPVFPSEARQNSVLTLRRDVPGYVIKERNLPDYLYAYRRKERR